MGKRFINIYEVLCSVHLCERKINYYWFGIACAHKGIHIEKILMHGFAICFSWENYDQFYAGNVLGDRNFVNLRLIP